MRAPMQQDPKQTTDIHVENDGKDAALTVGSDQTSAQIKRTPYLGIALSVLLATATFFSGLHIGEGIQLGASLGSLFPQSPLTSTSSSSSADLSQFWKVWSLLDQKFVSSTTTKPLTSEDKVRGAIDGLVRSYGDPYTIYMPPEDASMFNQDIAGNFSGVGMEVGMRKDIITVIAPLPDSPAEKAGILSGDAIVKIDGKSTEHMSVDQAVQLIRGEKGTEVTLAIYREGQDGFKDIKVTRGTISIPTSKTEVKGDVFIITLYSFNALSESEAQNALREYVKSGKEKLIIDLRGNPGGYLQSAVAIASYFLPVGDVIVRENFGDNAKENIYRSSGKELGAYAPKKLVLLVDGGSASASEILAGALHEHGVATLIGAQTFGKGSVQELINLDDGSSLKVTIARWLTPNGVSISAQGITPDIVVERTADDRTAGKDPQLEEAIKFLDK